MCYMGKVLSQKHFTLLAGATKKESGIFELILSEQLRFLQNPEWAEVGAE